MLGIVTAPGLVEHPREVAAVVARDSDVRSVTSAVGTTAAANQGQLTIDLKPIGERTRSADDISRDLTRAVYRGGRRPLDFYYRIHSGINGSGMLKQGKNLTPEQIWDVVNFVRALPYPEMRKHLVPPVE